MNLVETFIANPVKTIVGVLLLVLFGVISLLRMPMQLTPEVETPVLTINTRWPGASPQEIERVIVQEQEEQLKSVEGVRKMSSVSANSYGEIKLEFMVGTNMEEALLMVNSRLQQVPDYPLNADRPVIKMHSSSNRPIAYFALVERPPSAEQITTFATEHPALVEKLEEVKRTANPALAVRRLRELAAVHPEAAVLVPNSVDISTCRRLCEDVVEARFERVSGVADSRVWGGRMEELQVVVDPQQLAARQLTIADVRNALREQNQDTSGGDFWEGKRRYVVRTLGQFRSPEQVGNQILAIREGAPVYVHDVAEVRLGHRKPLEMVRRFGEDAISISVMRETGENVLNIMRGLRQATDELNAGPLKSQNVMVMQLYDETEYIYSAISLVNWNIVSAVLITVGVLLIFLRDGRTTLVISLAIPISLIGTFLVLDLLGRSLNVISLAGLAFAVGMLVDNAVVVLENIFRHYQLGEAPLTAAYRGTKEVWGAIAASTFTMLAVFLPVLFIEQEAGQLFRDIALAISAAIGLSLVVSVTVVPMIAARLLRRPEAAPHRSEAAEFFETVNGGLSEENGDGLHFRDHAVPATREPVPLLLRLLKPLDRLARLFAQTVMVFNTWLMHTALRQAGVVVAMIVLSVLFTWLLWPKVDYLPLGNPNMAMGLYYPPPGYNLNELCEMGDAVTTRLRPYWDLDPDSPEARKLDYPPVRDCFYIAEGRMIFAGLRAADPTRAGELVPLLKEVGSMLPGTTVVSSQSSLFEQGRGRNIAIEIRGPELPQLVALGGQIIEKIDVLIPGAQTRADPGLDLSNPEVHVDPKLTQAADLGIRAADLGYTVDALVDGAYASDFYVGGKKIYLVIRGRDEYAGRTQDLVSLPVATPAGPLVTLGDIADVRLSSGPEQIQHRERMRAITIEVSPPIEVPLEEAVEQIQTGIIEPLETSGALADGYHVGMSGAADKLRDTWTALRMNVVLAAIITYLLMAALFESWLYPLVIILTVPLGAVGGILGLQMLSAYLVVQGHTPQLLDVLTMLGFVILIGTVVNNPILIVHQALNHIRDDAMPPDAAVLESVRTRIRPIFITTSANVLGLVPLVFFPGAGSELYRGLGSVVLGGLVVSTFFTLFFVPALFSLVLEGKSWLLARWKSRPIVAPTLPILRRKRRAVASPHPR